MKINEHWTIEYRENRYLSHLNDAELAQRAKDISINLNALTGDSKFGVVQKHGKDERWRMLWTHILEEIRSRFGPNPNEFYSKNISDLPLPNPHNKFTRETTRTLWAHDPVKGERLFKYGSSKYLKDTLDSGTIRLASASSYSDPSLNFAIKDEELQIETRRSPDSFKVRVFNGKTGGLKGETHILNEPLRIRFSSDHFIYCMSRAFNPRLFSDFHADACLVIHKPDEFIARFNEVVDHALPNYERRLVPVNYIDPVLTPDVTPKPIRSKHFRFSYQEETRIVLIPPENESRLEPIFINLGSLSDCAEICDVVDS